MKDRPALMATVVILIALSAWFGLGVLTGNIIVVTQYPQGNDCGLIAVELRNGPGFMVSTCGPSLVLFDGKRMVILPDDWRRK